MPESIFPFSLRSKSIFFQSLSPFRPSCIRVNGKSGDTHTKKEENGKKRTNKKSYSIWSVHKNFLFQCHHSFMIFRYKMDKRTKTVTAMILSPIQARDWQKTDQQCVQLFNFFFIFSAVSTIDGRTTVVVVGTGYLVGYYNEINYGKCGRSKAITTTGKKCHCWKTSKTCC